MKAIPNDFEAFLYWVKETKERIWSNFSESKKDGNWWNHKHQVLEGAKWIDPLSDLKILTDYILSFKNLEIFDNYLIEKWSFELLHQGYKEESIYMLASFCQPIDYYDILPYLNKVFRDLRLVEYEEKLARNSFNIYHLNLINKGIDVKYNLSKIVAFNDYEFCDDLYLLHYAWNELFEIGSTGYYQNVSLDNIEQKIREQGSRLMKRLT
ncbi:hypothetical protein [Flavobacterium sp. NRK F7]|uniref:hypothetical protein n=1 Tax=Flavobacterium sp. NRK F7 TaxID=2954930 RepID=UPI0020919168|nr:hypothetical protein [Flavobacterium sp. NRK F7]MCO6163306.1 hypothetical protein [Flavobacterium sp. NRK F7]